jgi:broad specificity phosphatase PhoE
MTTRVTLISPARSEASEAVRFDADSPLSDAGERAAHAAAGSLPTAPSARHLVSPDRRCEQTARILGLDAVPAPQAAGCAMGRWRGSTLEEVAAGEPEAVARWLADPDAAPHGGESVGELCARVGKWLDELAAEPGRVVAVVEPDAVRAAVLHALGAPAQGLWRVDVEPLTAVELSGRNGRWNLRTGTRLG